MRIAQLLDQTSKNFPGGNDRGFEWSKQGSNELPTYFWVFPTEDFSGSVVEKTSHVVRNRPLKCPACDARSGYANSKEHIQGKVYVVCFFLHASKTQKNIFASTTLTLCRRERQERTSSASLCRSRHPLSRAASTAAAFLFLPLTRCLHRRRFPLSPSLSLPLSLSLSICPEVAVNFGNASFRVLLCPDLSLVVGIRVKVSSRAMYCSVCIRQVVLEEGGGERPF